MRSESKGQIGWLWFCMLFHLVNPESIPTVRALKAADNLVSIIMSSAHSLHCWQGINRRGQQAESHKNICTMQLEYLMFVNAMSVAMNHSSKLSCMRSSFVYGLGCRSISERCISGRPDTLVCLIKPDTTRKKTSI